MRSNQNIFILARNNNHYRTRLDCGIEVPAGVDAIDFDLRNISPTTQTQPVCFVMVEKYKGRGNCGAPYDRAEEIPGTSMFTLTIL